MKDEILRLLKEREQSYRCVLAQTALAMDGGVWKNVFTRFIALHKLDEDPVPLHYDYGEFLMASRSLRIEEFQTILESLGSDKKLIVPGTPLVPEVPMEGVFERREDEAKYIHSDEPHFRLDRPTNFYLFNPSGNYISSGKRAWALSHRDLPLFPDSTAAFESGFCVNVRGLTWEKAIAFCLPNYRAKIERIRIALRQASIGIITRGIAPEDVIGKVFVRTDQATLTQDLKFENHLAIVPFDGRLRQILVRVLSCHDNDLLDYRDLHLEWQRSEDAHLVSFDLSPDYLRQVIQQGESETLEFKRELKEEQTKTKLLETIVAFANANGGQILVGVDDDCNVVGIDEGAVLEGSIQNLIRSRCDPPAAVRTSPVKIDERTVLRVEVLKGDNPPYSLRDKGFYVRVGASNRLMTRSELDAIYQARNQGRNPLGVPFLDSWR